MDTAAAIRKFVCSNFYVSDPSALTDTSSLLDQGVIDSTGVLELLVFLEAEFGVEVNDDELVPEHLDSIAGIAAFVQRKGGHRRAVDVA